MRFLTRNRAVPMCPPPLSGPDASQRTDCMGATDPRPYRASSIPAVDGAVVIDAVPAAALKREVGALPSSQQLVCSGRLHVYWARATQIPSVLLEIGRLREVTFRAVGEGTGKSADIDLFDTYYLHMFLWDAHANTIVGAYRLGLVDEILVKCGRRGLYTHSLFEYRTRMFEALNPAIELGRSFVRTEYQRRFRPLLLLWCGIARFVERSPQYAVLFGPVSISNDYSPASRQLIVDYLAAHRAETNLVRHVTPRRPFRDEAYPSSGGRQSVPAPRSIDELSRIIEDIEPDHKGVPILLRQYLRLGGRILAFNIDREFGNVLDGLIMVDVRRIEPAMLARYMGEAGTLSFRAYHGLALPSLASSPSGPVASA
jgi:putative hemolysin